MASSSNISYLLLKNSKKSLIYKKTLILYDYMDNSDKKFLLEAVEDYEAYTSLQRALLRILISVAINDVAMVSAQYLREKLGVSRSHLYNVLRSLQSDDLITVTRLKNTQHNAYQINRKNLSRIIQIYKNKKSID